MGHEGHMSIALRDSHNPAKTSFLVPKAKASVQAPKPPVAKITCACGALILPSSTGRHVKSSEHKKSLERVLAPQRQLQQMPTLAIPSEELSLEVVLAQALNTSIEILLDAFKNYKDYITLHEASSAIRIL